MKIWMTVVASAALLVAGCASQPMGMAKSPAMMKNGMLVDAKGMTLYTFDRDVAHSGKSVCNGDCATKWPPLFATSSDQASGEWTVVMRDDGRRQWAFRGKPLYYWPEDQEPGDKYGDNYNKVWHVIR